MFVEFGAYFHISIAENVTNAKDFLNKYQGHSFGKGMYRLFRSEDVGKWAMIIDNAYPQFKKCFTLFAFDWLGRCFAIDLRKTAHYGKVLMFEIGTADTLEIPSNFIDFHNTEIPMYHDACLASSFFLEWKKDNCDELLHDECVGYKIPLFLGGNDNLKNLEKIDMEVYWHVLSAAILDAN